MATQDRTALSGPELWNALRLSPACLEAYKARHPNAAADAATPEIRRRVKSSGRLIQPFERRDDRNGRDDLPPGFHPRLRKQREFVVCGGTGREIVLPIKRTRHSRPLLAIGYYERHDPHKLTVPNVLASLALPDYTIKRFQLRRGGDRNPQRADVQLRGLIAGGRIASQKPAWVGREDARGARIFIVADDDRIALPCREGSEDTDALFEVATVISRGDIYLEMTPRELAGEIDIDPSVLLSTGCGLAEEFRDLVESREGRLDLQSPVARGQSGADFLLELNDGARFDVHWMTERGEPAAIIVSRRIRAPDDPGDETEGPEPPPAGPDTPSRAASIAAWLVSIRRAAKAAAMVVHHRLGSVKGSAVSHRRTVIVALLGALLVGGIVSVIVLTAGGKKLHIAARKPHTSPPPPPPPPLVSPAVRIGVVTWCYCDTGNEHQIKIKPRITNLSRQTVSIAPGPDSDVFLMILDRGGRNWVSPLDRNRYRRYGKYLLIPPNPNGVYATSFPVSPTEISRSEATHMDQDVLPAGAPPFWSPATKVRDYVFSVPANPDVFGIVYKDPGRLAYTTAAGSVEHWGPEAKGGGDSF